MFIGFLFFYRVLHLKYKKILVLISNAFNPFNTHHILYSCPIPKMGAKCREEGGNAWDALENSVENIGKIYYEVYRQE